MSTEADGLFQVSTTVRPRRWRAPFLLHSASVVTGVVRLSDLLMLTAAWSLALWIRFQLFPAETPFDPLQPPPIYIEHLLVALIVTMFLVNQAGLYDGEQLTAPRYSWGKLASALLTAFLVLVVLAFLSKTSEQISRGWILIWAGCAFTLMLASRFALRRALVSAARGGLLAHRAVIIGADNAGQQLYQHLVKSCREQVNVVAFFDDRATRIGRPHGPVPLLGGVEAAVDFIRSQHIEQVFVALPLNAEARVGAIIERLRTLPVDVLVTMGWAGHLANRPQVEDLGGAPLLSVSHRPLRGWAHIGKLLEDYVVGALALLFVAPLMLIIAGMVKLDSRGPVLFRQQRHGFNNELIEVYKFRTMYHGECDPKAARLTTKNDPRVTPLGRILRRTSLDELPQLFNVLNGSMSLVGPRPHALEAKAAGRPYAEAVARYVARHRVKPGITGWAQVNGWRGDTDTVEKIERRLQHDLYYIENWSLALDLRILAMTVVAIIRGTNAH